MVSVVLHGGHAAAGRVCCCMEVMLQLLLRGSHDASVVSMLLHGSHDAVVVRMLLPGSCDVAVVSCSMAVMLQRPGPRRRTAVASSCTHARNTSSAARLLHASAPAPHPI
jgi:hypothetical protein